MLAIWLQTKAQAGEEVADLYEGEFRSGLMEGYGVYYFGNCGWYSGQVRVCPLCKRYLQHSPVFRSFEGRHPLL